MQSFTALDSNYGDEWEHTFPEKLPLVIWLHGHGEGGDDPALAYTGNKVVAISSDDIQRKLGGAGYIETIRGVGYRIDRDNSADGARGGTDKRNSEGTGTVRGKQKGGRSD